MRLSASNLDAYASCPGRYWAEQGMAYQPSPFAEEGNLLHAAMAKSLTEQQDKSLTREQRRLVKFCGDRGSELIQKHVPDLVDWRREWKGQIRFAEGIVSGICDFTAWNAETALVVDWKFGRGEVEPIQSNYQLRAYAVMVARESFVQSVVVAIVQPHADRDLKVQTCEYDKYAIGAAEEDLNNLVTRIANTKVRTPGESQCRYCKALGTSRCPESAELSKSLVQIEARDVMPTGEELARLLVQAPVVEKMIDRLWAHALEEAKAGRLPGWEVVEGKSVRQIESAEAAWDALSGVMEPSEFMTACKVTIGALEDAYALKTGLRGAALRDGFNAALGSALSWRQNRDELRRKV